ncbi:MAG: undecaprenyldiphospho-muramoylpentapeptide beta-N-acetylglucosaminyltransferase [Provencibacterium sp.]|nr:undecaprenyldiphospho-muramoylpentapeptide beta-N-acetylglucosaminyltransferase [Provencibacterium sp.]
MKILFVCGGTAGHINPALAVAGLIRSRRPDAQIRFIGNPHGMEKRLVSEAGYPFSPVVVKGFYRSFSPKAIAHNLSAVSCMLRSSGEARRLLRDFSPDVVMGTGGYVSGPVLRAAAKLGFKTLTHESNAFPGVTTKLLARYVDRVLLAVEEAKKYLPEGTNCEIVGNPVREEIFLADREKSRKALGVKPGQVVLLTFGGSLGAQRVNEAVADLIAWHYKSGKVHHIHATGQYGVELLPRLLKERGVDLRGLDTVDIREYISDMPRCLAASDIVVCRAGAMTLSELTAAGRASVLIPSPNVAENHQYYNAMVLEKAGAAKVIEEKDLSGEKLCALVSDWAEHPDKLAALSKNASRLATPDAAERICDILLEMGSAAKRSPGR